MPAEPAAEPAVVLSGTPAHDLARIELGRADTDALGIAPGELELHRGWSGGPGRLTLEHCTAAGTLVAAQWAADRPALARRARETARTGRARLIRAGARTLLLQAGGADRRLPGLAPLLADPGAELLVHRAERRAVVKVGGEYAKVVRPARARRLAEAARAAARLTADIPFTVPEPLAVDEEAGIVRFGALAGRALHERLGEPGAERAAGAAGAAVRALHDAPRPAAAVVHDAAAEVALLERVTAELAGHAAPGSPAGVVAQGALRARGTVAARLCGEPAGALVAVHRDLHDKQLLVDDAGAVGILDFDTLAAGEAALDLGNLVVHLELRALQGACTVDAARTAREALLNAYAPDAKLLVRAGAYAQATRLRLACLYAFRPARAGVVTGLLSGAAPAPRRPGHAAGSPPAAPAR